MDTKLTSVWFNFPPSFYRRVQRIAQECGLTAEEVLRRGVALVVEERRENLKKQPKAKVKPGAALARIRWANTSAIDRRAIGIQLAAKRWGDR